MKSEVEAPVTAKINTTDYMTFDAEVISYHEVQDAVIDAKILT